MIFLCEFSMNLYKQYLTSNKTTKTIWVVQSTRGYEFWSSKLCEGDLITCRICIPNEFWSTFEALHIIGLFSDHVLKMKFGPLSNCRQNELWSTFDFRCNHWYESGAKFILAAIWKWTKLHFKHVIWESPEHMWRLAGGSKFIRYAYPAREKVSFTHFTGSKFIPSGRLYEINCAQ